MYMIYFQAVAHRQNDRQRNKQYKERARGWLVVR